MTGGVVQSRIAVGIGALANLGTVLWAFLALFVSGRGLGSGNEGFYLLSYEYWDSNPRTFTGAQYLFGPVFDLVGHDIAMLRVVRLALVVAVHVFFGVSFARWLRLQDPKAPQGAALQYCVASLVVVSAAIVYSWLPPTPGYNDVTLLGSMTMVGVLLVELRALELDRSSPRWTGVVWGLAAGAMVLAKPPVAITVLAIAAVSAYAIVKVSGRLLRKAAEVAVGVVLFAAGVQLVVMSWSDIVPPLRHQLGVVSSSTHTPADTVVWYVESSLALLRAVLLVCAPTALAASIAFVARGKRSERWRTVVVLLGFVASLALLAGAGGLRAGAGNVLAFTSGVVSMTVLVAAATILDRRSRRSLEPATVAVVALLLLTPFLQGFGTNNALYAVAVDGAAFWVALMLLAVSSLAQRGTAGPSLSVAATASAALLTVVVGLSGVTHDGSGRSLMGVPMASVRGSGELSTIDLPAAEAAGLTQLREDLDIRPGSHRPMLALGELAQYVLILGGRPIGTAWYSREDDGLNPADLRAACRHGNPWGADQPLVVASRQPSTDEIAAWRACGIDFERDYADVTPPSAPDDIRILRWQPPPGPPSTPPSAADSSASD